MANQTTNLLSLSAELHVRIATYLDWRSVTNLRATCRMLYFNTESGRTTLITQILPRIAHFYWHAVRLLKAQRALEQIDSGRLRILGPNGGTQFCEAISIDYGRVQTLTIHDDIQMRQNHRAFRTGAIYRVFQSYNTQDGRTEHRGILRLFWGMYAMEHVNTLLRVLNCFESDYHKPTWSDQKNKRMAEKFRDRQLDILRDELKHVLSSEEYLAARLLIGARCIGKSYGPRYTLESVNNLARVTWCLYNDATTFESGRRRTPYEVVIGRLPIYEDEF